MAEEIEDFWDKSAVAVLVLAYCGGLLFGIVVFGWQVLQWLKFGSWHPIPLKDAFIYYGADLTRVYSPQHWLGFAKICQWLLSWPLSVGLPVICIAAAHMWQWFVSQK